MSKKELTLNKVLKEKLQDNKFKQYFEEERDKLQIALKVATIREEKGLTQAQLAKKIHSSQTAISRIENGEYFGYSIKTLEKIAYATGTHLEINFI